MVVQHTANNARLTATVTSCIYSFVTYDGSCVPADLRVTVKLSLLRMHGSLCARAAVCIWYVQ